MKKGLRWPYKLIAPIGIILCQILILLNDDSKKIWLVAGIIIGSQFMMIVDVFINRNKINITKYFA